MFPNNSKLNIPGAQSLNYNPNGAMISNSFEVPNLPTAEPHDFVRSFLITILIIFITLALILFGYSFVLSAGIKVSANRVKQYDDNKSLTAFQTNLPEMKELSQRLKLLDNIYNKHLYISQLLLPVLESLTESEKSSYVYFNKFFVRQDIQNNSQTNSTNVTLSGVAVDYETLIRQINNFSGRGGSVEKNNLAKNFINNFKLNSLALNESGQVLFDLTFNTTLTGDKLKEYSELVFEGRVIFATSTVSSKPGPLFKQTVPAKNVTPVEVQDIYDIVNKNPSTSSGQVATSTKNSTEDLEDEDIDAEES